MNTFLLSCMTGIFDNGVGAGMAIILTAIIFIAALWPLLLPLWLLFTRGEMLCD